MRYSGASPVDRDRTTHIDRYRVNRTNGKNPAISVVIPVYNESESLSALYQGLRRELEQIDKPYEIVFVDDGSQDGSFSLLRTISQQDPKVKVICLRRNFGQTSALTAGFDHSTGDVIVTMDSDLQNDPADVPRLLAKLDEGYDIVSGWRRERKDPFLGKRVPSWLANKLTSWILGVPLHDYGCTLKAYRREVIEEIHLYSDFHRFIPGLASAIGARVAEVEVKHHPRRSGQSKYGISRIILGVLDLVALRLLVDYSTRPMRIFGGLGFISIVGAAVSGAATLSMKYLMGLDVTGNPLLYVAIVLALAGIQLVSLGFLGELTIRTYHEVQGKPTYVIRHALGWEPDNGRQLRGQYDDRGL